MAEKISIQIGLEGGDEVEKQLAAIGKAGEQAFNQLDESSGKASEEIAKVGDAAEKGAEGLDENAKATNKAAEAHSKLTLESIKTSAEIAKLGAEIAKIGVEIVQLIRHHGSLIVTLANLALGAAKATGAISGMAAPLASTAIAIAKFGLEVRLAVLGFELLERAATKVAAPFEKLNHDLQMLGQSSGQSFESLQQGESLFKQLTLSADTFRGTIAKIGETIAGLDVAGELSKSADEVEASFRKVLEAERELLQFKFPQVVLGDQESMDAAMRLLEINKALTTETNKQKELEDALANARVAHAEKAANSLSTVLEKVKAIEAGQRGITFDNLTKAETVIKAVGLSLKDAADQGKNAGQVLVQFLTTADRATATKVGAGFGLTAEDVDRIQRANGLLQTTDEIWRRIQSAGVLIPPESAAAFETMRDQMLAVEQAKARLDQAMGSTVFATWAAEVSSLLNALEAKFINFAAAAVESVSNAASQIAGTQLFANTKRELETIGAVLTALGGALVKVFTDPMGALTALGAAIVDLGSKFTNLVSTVTGFSWDNFVNNTKAAWNAVTGFIQGAIDKFLQFLGLQSKGGGRQPATGNAAGGQVFARGGRVSGPGSSTSDSIPAWLSRGEFVIQAAAVRRYGAGLFAALNAGRFARGGAVGGGSTDVFWEALLSSSGFQHLQQTTDETKLAVDEQGETIDKIALEWVNAWGELSAASKECDKNAKAIAGSIDVFAEALLRKLGSIGDNAAGGLLGGRGSGTSDSNLAWVSRGEHIMPARAVAQPGVLAFLEALRRSGGNLRGVLDGMGRFALGGMVPRMMPAFAGGGLAGGNHVTIAFPGLPPISGLRASSAVVDELRKSAALAQVRSGGRKPSRYS